MKIEKFEIDSWGTVKLHSEYHRGHQLVSEFCGVPKEAILKILQLKKAPDFRECEKIIEDAEDARAKKNSVVLSCGCGWWSDD